MATTSCAPRRRCRSRVAALAASSWIASSTIGNSCVLGRPRALRGCSRLADQISLRTVHGHTVQGTMSASCCMCQVRSVHVIHDHSDAHSVWSSVLSELLLQLLAGRRAASWQLTSGSSLRIAQRHRSEGEIGASFCADVMPSADKLSRCLLPQRARSTVLQERLLAGRPAGARPRGS